MKRIHGTLNGWRPWALSALRIMTAALFLEHGLVKVFGFPVPGPKLHGILYVAAALESVGAALLLLGVFSRLVAFVLCGEMAVAYFMSHAPRGFFPIANGGEAAILFCFVFLYLACAGGGPFSVDRQVFRQD